MSQSKTQISERTFRRLGAKLELVFKHLNRGLDTIEKLDNAEFDTERELLTAMVRYSLHDSWHVLTKLLRQISLDVDHDLPKGKGASAALIERMTQRTNERSAMIALSQVDKLRQIVDIYKDVRQSKLSLHPTSEVIELLEVISEEIVPEIMENIRVLALASPGGSKLLTHLHPKGSTADTGPIDAKRAAG